MAIFVEKCCGRGLPGQVGRKVQVATVVPKDFHSSVVIITLELALEPSRLYNVPHD